MSRPRWEVAEVFRQHGPAYRRACGGVMSRGQYRAMTAIQACRTSALGGHVLSCETCDHQDISYNSCRNRHCPKCQSMARARWLQERQAELLPVEYFHVVFTVPEQLNLLALRNDRLFYSLLFQVSAETLLEVAGNPKNLGAQLGVLSVLHTWGQNMMLHPHIHSIIPNGGLSQDGSRCWVKPKRDGFFLPVRVLSVIFRAKLLHALYQAHQRGEIVFPGPGLRDLEDLQVFQAFLRSLKEKRWVVYAKRPFGGPQQVLDYLGRYTHRVAISNERLVEVSDNQVMFRWKDYRHGNAQRILKIPALDFIRRFLTHVLPDRFVRIRYYGFLANAHRARNLKLCRSSLELETKVPPNHLTPPIGSELPPASSPTISEQCPKCSGPLRRSPNLEPVDLYLWLRACGWDTS